MTGVNLAMAKSPAGQALDFVSIMAYLAGDKSNTGFDWAEAYRAHRFYWPTQVTRADSERLLLPAAPRNDPLSN